MDVYKNIHTYSDLLETNIKFFNNEIDETYYYGGKWGFSEDQNNHADVATKNLIELTKYGFFTVNGQSSYNDKYIDQRSYLIFYMHKDTFNNLQNKLLNDNRIWTVFILPDYSIISNYDKSKENIFLTLFNGKECTIFPIKSYMRDEYLSNYKNIENILTNSVYCIVICKEFNKEPNSDQILLELINK